MKLLRYKVYESDSLERHVNSDVVDKLKYLEKAGAIKSYEFTKGILKIVFWNDTSAQFDYDIKVTFDKGQQYVNKELKDMWQKYRNSTKDVIKVVNFERLHALPEYTLLLDMFYDATTPRMDPGTLVFMLDEFRKTEFGTMPLGFRVSPRGFIDVKSALLDWQTKNIFIKPIFSLQDYRNAFFAIMQKISSIDHQTDERQIVNLPAWQEFVDKVRIHLSKNNLPLTSTSAEWTPGMWGR